MSKNSSATDQNLENLKKDAIAAVYDIRRPGMPFSYRQKAAEKLIEAVEAGVVTFSELGITQKEYEDWVGTYSSQI